MTEDQSNEQEMHSLPPGLLLRSFMLVAGGYVFSLLAFLLSFSVLTQFVFPEVGSLWTDQETLNDLMSESPEKVFTRPIYWSLVTFNALVCFGLGWAMVRLAPFGKFPHAVFLTILILVSYLQQSLGQPEAAKKLFTLMMIVFPIAVMAGAQLSWSRLISQPPGSVDE